MIQPPELTAIHPDTGFAFQLSDEAFSRWWAATVLPEDADQFVNLYHGTIDEARYVCAIDYLTNVMGQTPSSTTVMTAYFLARNEPVDLKDSHARTNAHYLSSSDATEFLSDRVRLRARRIAEERIASLTTTKIEELYGRALSLEGPEKLATERTALETSIKYLGNQSRERGQESERRAKKAVQNAIDRSKSLEYDVKRVPSPAEAKLHIAMLVDTLGVDVVADIVQEVKPHADDPRT